MSRSRGVRQKSIAFELTARDRTILMFCGLARYASSAQIRREFFPSDERCRKRLRLLYDGGLIAITLTASNAPSIVSLTGHGVRVVAETDPHLAEQMHLPGTLRMAGLAHHFGVVDARCYLAALTAAGGPRLLRWTNTDDRVFAGASAGMAKLVPDGFAELGVGDGRMRLAIEFDAGTEVLATVARKCERYAHVRAAGLVDEAWFIVTGSGQRAVHIAELVADARNGEWTRVMPHEHVIARPVRQPLARVGDREGPSGPITIANVCKILMDYPAFAARYLASAGGTDGGTAGRGK